MPAVMVGVVASISDVVLERPLLHVKGIPFFCFDSVYSWPRVTVSVDVTVGGAVLLGGMVSSTTFVMVGAPGLIQVRVTVRPDSMKVSMSRIVFKAA